LIVTLAVKPPGQVLWFAYVMWQGPDPTLADGELDGLGLCDGDEEGEALGDGDALALVGDAEGVGEKLRVGPFTMSA
jgi:hypothetical protein